MNKAFIIVGPESSGNRLFHRILIECGCYGDGGHDQRLDRIIPEVHEVEEMGFSHIVWGSSMPRASEWYRIYDKYIFPIEQRGYAPHVIVLQRDIHAIAHSQVKWGHVKDLQKAYNQITAAYCYIWDQLDDIDIPITIASYDSITRFPHKGLKMFVEQLGFVFKPLTEKLKDRNYDFYKEANP